MLAITYKFSCANTTVLLELSQGASGLAEWGGPYTGRGRRWRSRDGTDVADVSSATSEGGQGAQLALRDDRAVYY